MDFGKPSIAIECHCRALDCHRVPLACPHAGVAAGLATVPALRHKLACVSGIELPPSLRGSAWQVALLVPSELEQCELRLRGSKLAISAGQALSTAEAAVALPELPARMLARGLEMFSEAAAGGSIGADGSALVDNAAVPSRAEAEGRACALLLQAHECSSSIPTAMGSLALAIALGVPLPPATRAIASTNAVVPSHGAEGLSLAPGRAKPLGSNAARRVHPAQRPLEPAAVAMLLRTHTLGVHEAKLAAAAPDKGVQALLAARWPRLLKHLHSICSREDLADVQRRRDSGKAPRTELQLVLEEEWLHHGFVGSLPVDALLWSWDQFALQVRCHRRANCMAAAISLSPLRHTAPCPLYFALRPAPCFRSHRPPPTFPGVAHRRRAGSLLPVARAHRGASSRSRRRRRDRAPRRDARPAAQGVAAPPPADGADGARERHCERKGPRERQGPRHSAAGDDPSAVLGEAALTLGDDTLFWK